MKIRWFAKNSWLKLALLLLSAVLVSAGAIVVFLLTTFDVNSHREEIQRLVEQKLGRQLRLRGALTLRWLPSVALELGTTELKEKNSQATFATLENASVKLKLWPLLRNELQVERAHLAGLRLTLRRRADGSTNFDDLLPSGEASSWRLNLGPASLTESRIRLLDEGSGTDLMLGHIRAEIDALNEAQPANLKAALRAISARPEFTADIALQLRLRFGAKPNLIAVDNLRLNFSGAGTALQVLRGSLTGAIEWDGEKATARAVNLETTGQQGDRKISAHAVAPSVTWRNGELHIPALRMTGSAPLAEHKLDVALQATELRGPPAVLGIASVTAQLRLEQGDISVVANARAGLHVDLTRSYAQSQDLELRLDADLGARSDSRSLPLRMSLTRTGELAFNWDAMELRAEAGAARFTLARAEEKIEGEFHDTFSLAAATAAFSFSASELHARGRWAQEEISVEADARAQGQLVPARGEMRVERLHVRSASATHRVDARLVSPLPVSWDGETARLQAIDARVYAEVADRAYQGKLAAPIVTRTGPRWSAPTSELSVASRVDGRALTLALHGAIASDLTQERFAWQGRGRLDATNIQGQFALEDFSQPRYWFDLSADQLNLDRYLPAESKPKRRAPVPRGAGTVPWGETLAALRGMPVRGNLRVASLSTGATQMRDVRIELK